MSYRDTARAHRIASTTDKTWESAAHMLDAITRGVAPHHGTGYEPHAKADAYVQHVSDTAAKLREALADAETRGYMATLPRIDAAARELLRALGEDIA